MIVKVENVNGVLVTTSNRVAEELGVLHKDLLEKIDNYISKFQSAELSADFYIPSKFKDSRNRTYRNYLITKKGIAQLVGGYSSAVEKAFDLNVAYINRFEEMEKELQNKKQLSPAEFLLQQAQIMVEMEKRVAENEKSIQRLEHNIRRTQTTQHLTVIAYANMKGVKPNHYNSSVVGRKATKICKARDLQIGKVVDSKYGLINTYPEEVLEEIFLEM